jgi:hypothetical protein
LDALTLEDVYAMINFRCAVAQIDNPFDPDAVELIFNYSHGVPREVVKLCGLSVQYAILNDLLTIPLELIDLAKADMPELTQINDKKNTVSKDSKSVGNMRKASALGK